MLEELLACLGAVDDPRQVGKAEHRLIGVLAISVCAVLAGAESFEDIVLYGRAKRAWPSQFLALPGGIPSHDTVRRVLMLIAPEQFEDAFLAWTRQALFTGDGDGEPMQIAIDGKTVRRSFDRRRERMPPRLVSAFATQSGLVLAQRRVPGEKGHGGEMGALPDLLAGLDLRGTPVSPDAGACHPRAAEAVTARGGDHLHCAEGQLPCPAWRGARLVRRAGLLDRRRAAPLCGRHRGASRPVASAVIV